MNYEFKDYEQAILTALEDLSVENGGYLQVLKGQVAFSHEFLADFMEEAFVGRYPGVFVEITSADYGELKGKVQRQTTTITLYIGTKNFRSQDEARQAGTSKILKDLRTRLLGKTPTGLTGVLPLEIVREYKIGASSQFIIYGAEYSLVNPRIPIV